MFEAYRRAKEVLRGPMFSLLSLLVTNNLKNDTPELCPVTSFGKKWKTVPCKALCVLVIAPPLFPTLPVEAPEDSGHGAGSPRESVCLHSIRPVFRATLR